MRAQSGEGGHSVHLGAKEGYRGTLLKHTSMGNRKTFPGSNALHHPNKQLWPKKSGAYAESSARAHVMGPTRPSDGFLDLASRN